MDEPRTWRIEMQWSGVQLGTGPELSVHDPVEVIEKFAYDALKARLDELKERFQLGSIEE